MFKVNVRYPSLGEMTTILRRTTEGTDITVEQVMDGPTLMRLSKSSCALLCPFRIQRQLRDPRDPPESDEPRTGQEDEVRDEPQSAQAMVLGGKVRAVLSGRHYVSYLDVNDVALTALRHRVILN